MKIIHNRLITPIGIAFVAVQWLVVAFAILGDDPSPGFGKTPWLMQYLSFFNLPALLLTGISWKLILSLGADPSIANYALTTLAAVFVSLQWFLIGSIVDFVIREVNLADGADEVHLDQLLK